MARQCALFSSRSVRLALSTHVRPASWCRLVPPRWCRGCGSAVGRVVLVDFVSVVACVGLVVRASISWFWFRFWHNRKFFFAAFGGDEENFSPFSRVFINKSAKKRDFLPNFAQKCNFSLEIVKKCDIF